MEISYHGFIRRCFPGGFPGDDRDAFDKDGRTIEENNIWEFMKSLIELRKTHAALSRGDLMHLAVFDEFYIYFRTYNEEKIMMIANNKAEKRDLELKFLEKYVSIDAKLINLKMGEEIESTIDLKLSIPGYDVGIYKIM